MSDGNDPTTRPQGRLARLIKPAAVDIIRKKNLQELAGESRLLRRRLDDLQAKNARLLADMSALESELSTLRSDVEKTRRGQG